MILRSFNYERVMICRKVIPLSDSQVNTQQTVYIYEYKLIHRL